MYVASMDIGVIVVHTGVAMLDFRGRAGIIITRWVLRVVKTVCLDHTLSPLRDPGPRRACGENVRGRGHR